jgi:hypothetical protein
MLQTIPAMRRKRGFEKRYTNFKEDMMSFIKSSGGIWVTFIALAMLAAGSKIALADTTTLICHMNNNPYWYEEGPTSIELNEAQSIVVVNYAAYHGKRSGYTGPPAVTRGPFQATFSADIITWQDGNGKFTINRLTGVFSGKVFFPDGRDGDDTLSYTSHAAQKQF